MIGVEIALCGSAAWQADMIPALRQVGVEIAFAVTTPDEACRHWRSGLFLLAEAGPGANLPGLAAIFRLVAALPAPDYAAARVARQAGAAEAFVLPHEAEDLVHWLQENQVELVAPAPGPASGGLLIVTAPRSGAGASVLAQGLALALRAIGPEVGLLDLHTPYGDQEAMLNLEPYHSLFDLTDYVAHLEARQVSQAAAVHASGVAVLCAPARRGHRESLRPDEAQAITAAARRTWEWAVVDTPSSPDLLEAVAGEATELLVVTTPDPLGLRATHLLMKGINLPPHTRLVVNHRAGAAAAYSPEELSRHLGLAVAGTIPHDPQLAYRTTLLQPVVQCGRRPPAGEKAIVDLARRLAGGRRGVRA